MEFALYPNKDSEPHNLSLDDFALFILGSDIATKPESSTVVAASLKKKANSGCQVSVQSGTSIGYESGTYIDPVTGQPTKVHGVYTASSVGVGIAIHWLRA